MLNDKPTVPRDMATLLARIRADVVEGRVPALTDDDDRELFELQRTVLHTPWARQPHSWLLRTKPHHTLTQSTRLGAALLEARTSEIAKTRALLVIDDLRRLWAEALDAASSPPPIVPSRAVRRNAAQRALRADDEITAPEIVHEFDVPISTLDYWVATFGLKVLRRVAGRSRVFDRSEFLTHLDRYKKRKKQTYQPPFESGSGSK